MTEEEFKSFIESGSEQSKDFIKKASILLFKQKLNDIGFDSYFEISENGNITGRLV